MLEQGGFQLVGDLDGLTPSDLAADLGVETSLAASILSLVHSGGLLQASYTVAPITDALSLYNKERAARRITTLGRELDELLCGGVPLRQLSEFSGVPGVGKTQLAMQLALTVQIPESFDGLDGEAVYIDTEGSFHAQRCLSMANALIERLRSTAAQHDGSAQQKHIAGALTGRDMLDRIHFFRVHDGECLTRP